MSASVLLRLVGLSATVAAIFTPGLSMAASAATEFTFFETFDGSEPPPIDGSGVGEIQFGGRLTRIQSAELFTLQEDAQLTAVEIVIIYPRFSGTATAVLSIHESDGAFPGAPLGTMSTAVAEGLVRADAAQPLTLRAGVPYWLSVASRDVNGGFGWAKNQTLPWALYARSTTGQPWEYGSGSPARYRLIGVPEPSSLVLGALLIVGSCLPGRRVKGQ